MTIRVAYTLEQCHHRVPGGTATSAVGVARAMAAEVDDIDLIGVTARHPSPAPEELTAPIEMRALPLPRRALYETWHVLGRPRIERATGPVDVIHATGMAIPPRTAPLVVTVHDLAFVHHPEHATRNGLRFFRQSIDRTRRRADLVLCPSEATRRDCVDAGLDATRVRVVPWGVDPVPDHAPAFHHEVLLRHGLSGSRYVLFVGTIEPRKNLEVLVDAFARVASSGLTLALVGPAGWNEDLAALVGPVRDHVRVLGHVPRADLDVLYGGASVFCYPSLLEGFGMPVLEAMAAGAPVITSSGTATAEVAGGAAVLVDPRDPVTLANEIARIVDDAAVRDHLRLAGRTHAAAYTWARAARATADAYRSLVR